MSILKKISITVLLLAVIVGIIGYYYYNKPREGADGRSPVATLTASALLDAYDANEEKANADYNGKVIVISGKATEKSADAKGIMSIMLQGTGLSGVNCQFSKSENEKISSVNTGDSVYVKGICTGKLTDVVLVDCVFLK